MAASIVRTICPVGVYTLIADQKDRITFRVRSLDGGRLAVGASQPAPTEQHYKSFKGGEDIELPPMGSTTRYWWMSLRSDQAIEVIMG